MSKSAPDVTNTSTQKTTLDPQSQRFLEAFRSNALGNFGQSGQLPPGLENFSARSNLLSGSPLDFASQTGLQGINQFLNPELENVIGGVRGDFDRQREFASNRAGQLAESESAFGGSRSAILEAQGLSDVNRQESSTIAGLRSNAFNNARASLFSERGRLGQLGLAGLSNQFGLGQFMNQRQQQALQGLVPGLGVGGSTVETQNVTPMERGGFLQNALGGAGIGASFGPGGAAIGGGISGLLGLFG